VKLFLFRSSYIKFVKYFNYIGIFYMLFEVNLNLYNVFKFFTLGLIYFNVFYLILRIFKFGIEQTYYGNISNLLFDNIIIYKFES
jgi:hypothetical protein